MLAKLIDRHNILPYNGRFIRLADYTVANPGEEELAGAGYLPFTESGEEPTAFPCYTLEDGVIVTRYEQEAEP